MFMAGKYPQYSQVEFPPQKNRYLTRDPACIYPTHEIDEVHLYTTAGEHACSRTSRVWTEHGYIMGQV